MPAPTPVLAALDDAALARRVMDAGAAHDPAAEAELYRRLAPRARLYGLRHLRDADAAADLAQEVLLLTLRRLREGTLREPAQLASFVLGACRQSIVDQRRGERRRGTLRETFAGDLVPTDIDTPPSLDRGPLLRCLMQLAERERSILLMSFFDDRDADDVALDLGLTAGNVRVIRHRGLDRLRRCLGVVADAGAAPRATP